MNIKQTLLATTIAGLSTFSHAAQHVDLMITDALVLTMNQEKTVYQNGTVVIDDNKIVAVATKHLPSNTKPSKHLMWMVIS